MANMSRGSQELLKRARAAQTLSDVSRERMYGSLTQRLARGDQPLPEIDVSDVLLPRPSWLSKLLATTSAKLSLAGLGALLLVAAGLSVRNMPASPDVAARALPVEHVAKAPMRADTSRSISLLEAASTEESVPALRTADSLGEARSDRAAKPRRARRTVPTSSSTAVSSAPNAAATLVAPTTSAAPVSTLDAELKLLQDAYAALQLGRASQALAILSEHQTRFPQGQLAEAREVAFMLALCKEGRVESARERARRFLTQHPQSPFAGRVRAVCPSADKKTSP
jgi:TolA-binding protein